MPLIDPNDRFFRPVWRRWATAGVPAAWACVEAAGGNSVWALAFAALAGYAFWKLIVQGPDNTADPPGAGDPPGKDGS